MAVYDTFANKHPTTFLAKFFQINMGCMDWTIMSRTLPNVDGSKPTVVAMVMIHGKVITDAQAESSRYAKVAAAKKAQQLLEGLPVSEFRSKYHCDCRPEDVKDDNQGHYDDDDNEYEVHGTAV